MRARNIKPAFFKNERLAECSPTARLLFIGLWCYADREGRFEWRPRRIKAEILPYRSGDVNKLLQELLTAKVVIVYNHSDKSYGCIPTFLRHQRPHHNEAVSSIPAPPKELQQTFDYSSKPLQPKNVGLRSDPLLINDDCGEWSEEGGKRNPDLETPPAAESGKPVDNPGEGMKGDEEIEEDMLPGLLHSLGIQNKPPVTQAYILKIAAKYFTVDELKEKLKRCGKQTKNARHREGKFYKILVTDLLDVAQGDDLLLLKSRWDNRGKRERGANVADLKTEAEITLTQLGVIDEG